MEEEIFSISKSPVRAKALKDMAVDRLNDIKIETKPYKITEQYYEVIKELITALMYSDGFKTLSHKSLIDYLRKNYFKHFNENDLIIIDELRRLRNDILYYGKKVDSSFLANREGDIKKIIGKLLKVIGQKQG